jgi:hypothetical protein
MAAGRLPWLRVERTGIALLGVVALLGSEAVALDPFGGNVDSSTLVLLFAPMVVAARRRGAGRNLFPEDR